MTADIVRHLASGVMAICWEKVAENYRQDCEAHFQSQCHDTYRTKTAQFVVVRIVVTAFCAYKNRCRVAPVLDAKEVSEMPKIRNILPKKDVESGASHDMRPFTHSMEEFFGNHFPRRWMEGFFESEGWKRPFWNDLGETFDVWPKVDVLDKKDALVVRAELPGIKKEDLEVTIAGDRLTLEAERNFEEKEEKKDFFRPEIAYGRLLRTVHLPVEIKGEEAKAELKDGVVEIYLPKVKAVTPHTVKVA